MVEKYVYEVCGELERVRIVVERCCGKYEVGVVALSWEIFEPLSTPHCFRAIWLRVKLTYYYASIMDKYSMTLARLKLPARQISWLKICSCSIDRIVDLEVGSYHCLNDQQRK